MKIYTQMSVGDLLKRLDELSWTPVALDLDADSYRGYYRHVGISHLEDKRYTAKQVADYVRSRVGTTMQGYKGGEFDFTEGCLVFIAPYGDTGPMLLGIEDDGSLVAAEESWAF